MALVMNMRRHVAFHKAL